MVALMGVFSHSYLFFNFLLKLFVINLTHFTGKASSSWIIVITISAHCTFWALDKLMSRLAPKVGFAGQNGAFVLKWGFLFESCPLCLSDILIVTKTCHHCVQVELLGFCTPKSGRLLSMEKYSGLLACCLLGLSVYKGTLVLITDVFLDELLFFVLTIVDLSITLHHSVHCWELAIVHWWFALIVPQTTEAICSLVVSDVICPGLEIITCSKLLIISSILINKLLHLIVLWIECVHKTILIGPSTSILAAILGVLIVSWDISLRNGSCRMISIFFVLVITDEIVVCKAQRGCLEIRLLTVWIYYAVHLIILLMALRAKAWAIVKELSLLVRILTVFTTVVVG